MPVIVTTTDAVVPGKIDMEAAAFRAGFRGGITYDEHFPKVPGLRLWRS